MKKLLMVAAMATLCIGLQAQNTGVQFVQAANWKEVLKKAKKENKHIFIDFYATWCGPCKAMDANIFPLAEVGEYFNANFVSVKIQMDMTKNDKEHVKKWYKDARFLEKEYGIMAYPTYMVLSPDGKPLHRLVGGFKTGAEFIAKVKDAFVPTKAYYANVADYKSHLDDSAYLRNAIKVSLQVRDRASAAEIGNYYFDVVKDHFAKANVEVFASVLNSSKDKAYNFFLNNPGKVDAVSTPGYAASQVSAIMYTDDIKPVLESDKDTDWPVFKKQMKEKYKIVSDKSLDELEIRYYVMKNKTADYDKAVMLFMNKYSAQMGDWELNQNAWIAFNTTNTKEVLEEALKWTELAFAKVEKGPNTNYANYIDTYANLYYKLGKKEEAITWQQKGIDIASAGVDKKKVAGLNENLEKMKKNEKTW